MGWIPLMPQMLDKISRTRKMAGDDVDIQVDGGITAENAGKVISAGANILVSGSSVFSAPDYAKAIEALRGKA